MSSDPSEDTGPEDEGESGARARAVPPPVRPPPGRLPPPGKLPPRPAAKAAPPAEEARDRPTLPAPTTAPAPRATDEDTAMEDAAPPEPPRSEPPPRMASIPTDLTGALPVAIARFGRFEILGGVASGGMADILLARESTEGSSRHTVIKVVRGEHSENGQFAQMFLDEGRLAMRLSHPSICTVYECGHVDGRYFIAMEYVHGKPLRDLLVRSVQRKEPLPIPVLLRIFSSVAEALDFAHRARDAQGKPLEIVHRDVSPQNVMVRYDGVVKLLDFGVAKAATQIHESESGALKGKFAYMSPEQAEGGDVDARADIFALGVMLFEAITGRRLFHRKSQYATLKALLESTPPPLSQYREGVPEGLQAIIDRTLARERDERYARASDLQHDLEKVLAKRGQVVTTAHVAALMNELFGDTALQPLELDTSPSITERFPSIAPLPPPAPAAAPVEPPPPPRRSRAGWLAVGAIALTSVGIGLGVALAPGAPPSTATTAPTEPTPPPRVADPPPPPPEPPAVEAVGGGGVPSPPGDAVAPPEVLPEEPPPSTTATTPRSTSRRGRRRTANGRSGGGTVIVSDPGF